MPNRRKSVDSPSIRDQVLYLTKGAVDLIVESELEDKLKHSRDSGQPLKVKVGFDPSAPDIHLGHTVLLRKMKHFQDLGHDVVFLVGDFTGFIGDPTGRSRTRPQLTRDQIAANAETYTAQAFKILNPERTEVRFNSEWLGRLGAEGLIRLAARYNVARMLERRDFRQRYEAGHSIRIHEFLYPLAQAYDSVFLKADVELGGTDQLFNLNVGRDIMPEYGLSPQVVLTTPLLVGTDGTEKMSKSLKNAIGVTEPPGEIFGKIMSISDDLMWSYYTLLTDRSLSEIEKMKRDASRGAIHPRDLKMALARRLVADFHGTAAGRQAEEEFSRIFTQGGPPDQIPEVVLEEGHEALVGTLGEDPDTNECVTILLPVLLAREGLAASRSAARRLLSQGAVRPEGEPLHDDRLQMDRRDLRQGIVLKVGKHRFIRIKSRI
ncbi:MAG: tyrosine--tRNA ligase [Acidobacteriota bacterium]